MMSSTLHSPSTLAAPPLRFRCGLCAGVLEVPATMAGVSGPCPLCRGHITAPIPLPAIPAEPIRQALSAAVSVPEAAPASREKGYFADAPAEPPEAGTHERRGGLWLDRALIALLIGTVLACIAAVLWTEPANRRRVAVMPENLENLIEQEQSSESNNRGDARILAGIQATKFLASSTAAEAATFLQNPPADLAWPLFPGLGHVPLKESYSRRIPGTSRYLIGFAGPDGAPELPMEMTESGPLLHTGVILQQSNKTFNAFRYSMTMGPTLLYVLAAPCPDEVEADNRRERPDLAAYRIAELLDPFQSLEVDPRDQEQVMRRLATNGGSTPAGPEDVKKIMKDFRPAISAYFLHSSPAGVAFSARAHDPGHRRACVEVKWQRHREAGPWVEIIRFLPDVWCGDRPAGPASPAPAPAPAN